MPKITYLISSCQHLIRNLSMKYKIQLISICGLILLAVASVFITNILLQNYNNLLIDSVSASLDYANEDLTEKLDNAYQLSYTILADSSLQQRLYELKNISGTTERAGYYTQLNSRLQSYYLEHQKDYISYISLYTDAFTCHTSPKKAGGLNSSQIEAILSAAHEEHGKAVWITDYTSGHGLILTREIRRYQNLSLETLGTIVICINLDGMLNSCPMFTSYDSFYYLIEDEHRQIIYNSIGDTITLPSSLFDSYADSYKLVKLDHHWYFSMRGELYQKGWHYTCLVSYDRIHNTLRSYNLISFTLILCCGLIIVLVSRYLIRTFTRHFDYLILKMKRFGESKDSLTNFEPDSRYGYENRKDEIGMLHQQFDHMASQISELVESNYTKELLVKEAQLKALEMQINPHFLYNTLESINWRAKAIGASKISLMVEAMGNLFRAILSKSDDTFTIKQELALVSDYLTIQKCRFDARLSYHILTNSSLDHARVPKMIIQPLVENAVSHAMETLIEECVIEIAIQKSEDNLHIFVKNTGSQFEENLLEKLKNKVIKPKGFGIGLLNIDNRVKLMFGPVYGLKLYNEADMAVALISLPYTTEKEIGYPC